MLCAQTESWFAWTFAAPISAAFLHLDKYHLGASSSGARYFIWSILILY
jgi:hypothetical protein